jgi:Xaa-Pro aminopeptidase
MAICSLALTLLTLAPLTPAVMTGAELPDHPVPPPQQELAAEASTRRATVAKTLGEAGGGLLWLEAEPGEDLGRFFQSDNFYYLSGIEIPEIAMAIRVGPDGKILDEVLLLPPHNPMFEVWNGARLAPGEEAEKATGFRRTASLRETQTVFDELADGAGTVFVLRTPALVDVPAELTVDTEQLAASLGAARLIKSDYEVHCLKNAIDITTASFHEALAEIAPDRWEFQVQAAMERGFRHRGSERPGFASICGSGPNSVTLHYIDNERQMQDGDLIVIDVGAKYRYYSADVTRTVPVNGVFTDRQREVYELVLAAQTAAAEAAQPGMTIKELDQIARKIIVDGGFGPDRAYFKHGVGHWIGLDVHDKGGRVPIPVGALFTIEPGIYIVDEALGVRIEDDYIMTPSGAEKLSDGVTSDPDELEALLEQLRD